jgi:hypothetical protein
MVRYLKQIQYKAFRMLGLHPFKKYPKIPKLKSSLRSVARQLGIKSYNTLKYWIIHDLLSVKNKNRKNKRGRKNKLTEQQQQLIFGYMLFLQSQYLPITRNKIHYFITTQINRSISKNG